ncbi:MAG: hypothetical protein JWP44_4130 [Mucilaginibacter sp.]|nr:hypothetical protein [Mucilaginibacter sp.]
MAAGPSHFVEVSNVTYGAQAVFGISNIKITQNRRILKGMNNNVPRYVSSHTVFYDEQITFDCDDINTLEALEGITAPSTLAFDWIAASQQLTTSPLANQEVTISNVVIEKVDWEAISKNFGKVQVSGCILGIAAGTNPIAFTAGS